MAKQKTITKTSKCHDFDADLEQLVKTGNVSDRYVQHLAVCSGCQCAMQKRVLTNARALKRA